MEAGGHFMAALFEPASIAIVGASENNYYTANVFARLTATFNGEVRLVNPNRRTAFCRPCVHSLSDLDLVPDLVFVAVPRARVLSVIDESARLRVGAAIVISNGFGESALPDGAELQSRIASIAEDASMLMVGPSCLGVANLNTGLNAFGGGGVDAKSGNIAFVTQSGGNAMAFQAGIVSRGLGCSVVVSTGNEACLTSMDFVEYALHDPSTAVVCAFMEGLREPDRVLDVGRLAAEQGKPIVVMKAGRSPGAARAARSHTGAVTGPDDFNRALLRRSGFLVVDTIDELLDTAAIFSRAPDRRWRPVRRLGILTASGGAAAILSDHAAHAGIDVPELSESTTRQLKSVLPPHIHAHNPLDISGTVQRRTPDVWRRALDLIAQDPAIDAVAVVSGLLDANDEALVDAMADTADRHDTPLVLVSISPTLDIIPAALTEHVRALQLPYAMGFDAAVTGLAAINHMTDRPAIPRSTSPAAARPALGRLMMQNGPLRDRDAAALLAEYGIARPIERYVRTPAECIAAAEEIGYPVVLKISSIDVPHRSELGLVAVGLRDKTAVYDAANRILTTAERNVPGARDVELLVQEQIDGVGELVVGVSARHLGRPLLVVGPGGVFVELFDERAMSIPPIDLTEAARLLQQLRYSRILGGVRGRPPADTASAVRVIEAVAAIADASRHRILELEINPLIIRADGGGAVAVDVLVEFGTSG